MAQKSPKYVGDAKIRALLEANSCPTPFHACRMPPVRRVSVVDNNTLSIKYLIIFLTP